MQSDFFKLSKEVANRFIQSIVFIDDRAFLADTGDNTNAFNSNIISKAFAESGKICAIYAPITESDIKTYYPILNKADIVILDWYLQLTNESDRDLDPEADAEMDDPRGEYTISLIRNLTDESSNKNLKLIVIYTGDNIAAIKDEIAKEFSSSPFKEEDFSMQINNVRIVLRGKGDNSDKQYNYNTDLNTFVVPYIELPDHILNEFTKMSSGLVSNYALESATLIREQTSRILGVFSPSLDPAYLGHRTLLENPSDAKSLLTKLYGDVITELIEAEEINTDKWIEYWLSQNISENEIMLGGNKIVRNQDILLNIINSSGGVSERIQKATKVSVSKKDGVKYISHLFKYKDVNVDNSNISFAQLTHHKNAICPIKTAPVLTLGTIIKKREDRKTTFFICIQQRCDSVRIPNEDSNDRRFIFLPLTEKAPDAKDSQNRLSPIIIDNATILYLNGQSFDIKTIRFKANATKKVNAVFIDDKWIFKSIHKEVFEWVVDLKELHAQRIVNNYCAQLSRVGLNESEWLRLYK